MSSATHDVVHERAAEDARAPRPYANPYLAGIGLGLVLLSAFVLVGRGLGASGAFNAAIAWLVSLAAPAYARSNGFLGDYLAGDAHPLKAWLVFEVVGLLVGALLSGLLAGRVKSQAINLGTGRGYSVREVIETARHVTGRNFPVRETTRRPGDPPELVAAVDRAKKVLGWTAIQSDLEYILRTAWKWARSMPPTRRAET